MGRVSNWFYNHSFHREDPGRLGVTPGTMWESVLLVILLANLILILIVLMFPHLAF